MAKTDLSIPSLGNKFVDLRDSLPGDSYNWSWIRPLGGVNYLAIHHSASPDTQTPQEIANYHINSNGWGGIGYHFVIAKDGIVFYVGDISSARANVANMNEQVIGICLVGNFMSGNMPTSDQLASVHLLCDFFISYPDLTNLKSWDLVKGHKELPNQATACPGDTWSVYRQQIVSGGLGAEVIVSPPLTQDRGAQITEAYQTILGRDPDIGGLQNYTNGTMTIDEIMRAMVNSQEHQNLIRLGKEAPILSDQLSNLQASLSSLNGQVINLQKNVGEKDNQISWLKTGMADQPVAVISNPTPPTPQVNPDLPKPDNTLTIAGVLINLYKFLFWPRKDSLVGPS